MRCCQAIYRKRVLAKQVELQQQGCSCTRMHKVEITRQLCKKNQHCCPVEDIKCTHTVDARDTPLAAMTTSPAASRDYAVVHVFCGFSIISMILSCFLPPAVDFGSTAHAHARLDESRSFPTNTTQHEVICHNSAQSATTSVIALWDINRAVDGDGRPWYMYVRWLRETLKLNTSIVLFAERATIESVRSARDHTGFATCYVHMELSTHPYHKKYYERNKQIISSPAYRTRMSGSRRPSGMESVNPHYNVLVWGKIELMRMVSREYNFFSSSQLVWVDAGISRFFERKKRGQFPHAPTVQHLQSQHPEASMIISTQYNKVDFTKDHAMSTASRHLLCRKLGVWSRMSIFSAGMFVMKTASVQDFAWRFENAIQDMLSQNATSNEQILFFTMWCTAPRMFTIIYTVGTFRFQEILYATERGVVWT